MTPSGGVTRYRSLGQSIAAYRGIATLAMSVHVQETEATSMNEWGNTKGPDDEMFWSSTRRQKPKRPRVPRHQVSSASAYATY